MATWQLGAAWLPPDMAGLIIGAMFILIPLRNTDHNTCRKHSHNTCDTESFLLLSKLTYPLL